MAISSEKCIACQRCCKEISLHLAYAEDPRLIGWLHARGARISHDRGLLVIQLPSVCPKLSDSGCTIYETRPAVCKNYNCEEK